MLIEEGSHAGPDMGHVAAIAPQCGPQSNAAVDLEDFSQREFLWQLEAQLQLQRQIRREPLAPALLPRFAGDIKLLIHIDEAHSHSRREAQVHQPGAALAFLTDLPRLKFPE